MKTSQKILALIFIFAIQSALHLVDGFSLLYQKAGYGEYGHQFVMFAIMAYIAYLVYSVKDKSSYWLAVIFAGLVLLRSVLGAGAILLTSTSSTELISVTLSAFVFAVVPLFLLSSKDIRLAYLKRE